MQQHGWTLLFHDNLIEQLTKLRAAVLRAQENDPEGFASNANVKFFRALVQLMQDVVPSDPARDEYRQGNTMGSAYRHWRRANSEGGTGCSSGTTRKRRSSCTPGSTTSRPCDRRAASPTRMPSSRRCWDAATRRTIGRRWWPQARPTGAQRTRSRTRLKNSTGFNRDTDRYHSHTTG